MQKSKYKTLDPEKNITPRCMSISDSCQRYGLGRDSMTNFAKKHGAFFKIGTRVLVNVEKLDGVVDQMCEQAAAK